MNMLRKEYARLLKLYQKLVRLILHVSRSATGCDRRAFTTPRSQNTRHETFQAAAGANTRQVDAVRAPAMPICAMCACYAHACQHYPHKSALLRTTHNLSACLCVTTQLTLQLQSGCDRMLDEPLRA